MAIKPTGRRAVTVTDHASTTTSKASAQIGNSPNTQKDLHPLPAIHLDAEDMSPQGLQKKFLDIYEGLRIRTDAQAKNPLTAPAYEKNIAFRNTANTAQNVTVTFAHSLGRAPTHGVTCFHSTGAAYQGFSVPNPQGQDPATHQTVTALVPPNTTALHSFMLTAD